MEYILEHIQDALKKLTTIQDAKVLVQECELYMWPQTWSDASCGSGGLSCQAITSAPTLAVVGPIGDVCIYHGPEFAYYLEHPSELFWKDLDNRNLPGTTEHTRRRCLEKTFETVSEQ